MSLDRVKMETSSSQFVLWMKFFEWEANAFDATRCYLAQIAAEIRRGYVKEPRNVKVSDFIMKFESPTEKAETPTETQAKTSRIKSAFFALTGLIGKKKRDK
jgi:hypothetical protein